MPCFGLGLSMAGFWDGKLIGKSITLYFTLEFPSATFSVNESQRKAKG